MYWAWSSAAICSLIFEFIKLSWQWNTCKRNTDGHWWRLIPYAFSVSGSDDVKEHPWVTWSLNLHAQAFAMLSVSKRPAQFHIYSTMANLRVSIWTRWAPKPRLDTVLPRWASIFIFSLINANNDTNERLVIEATLPACGSPTILTKLAITWSEINVGDYSKNRTLACCHPSVTYLIAKIHSRSRWVEHDNQ